MSIEDTAFLGLTFADESLDTATNWVIRHATTPGFRYVVTPNVDHLVRLDRIRDTPLGQELYLAYQRANLCLCDSRVISRLARAFGRSLAVVPGSDLTAAVLENVPPSTRIAIVGADPASIADLASRYSLTDVVQHHPPMGMINNPDAMADAVAFIQTSGAALIFLAIGSPQSEILALRAANAGANSAVALCIGASIDFLTGRQTRAPRWVQRTGFEWAYRLLSEPRRMWRRYLIEGPRIFWIALRDRGRDRNR